MKEEEPILIVGTGALAGLFAARLAACGRHVTLLGSWSAGLKALGEYGIRLTESDGRTGSYPVRPETWAAQEGFARLALVLVKSWQTARAAQQLTECLAADGIALTLQNGVGNREILVQALGAERVAAGVTTTGAYLLGPGRVQAVGTGVLSLETHPRLGPLQEALLEAGFVLESTDEVESLLWGKVVINAAINPLTALLNVRNGQLLEIQAARELALDTAREAARAAFGLGIRLPFEDPGAAMEAVARETAANRSSMLQDIQRGAPTEIDSICGAVVRGGQQTGVATPLNRILCQLVRARAEVTRVAN